MVDMSFPRIGLTLASAALMILTACAEREEILTGPREDIRPEGQSSTAPPEDGTGPRAISLGTPSTNSSWTQGIGSPSFRPSHPALRATPQRVWTTDIGEGDTRRTRITAEPVVGGGLIYTLDSGATVSAVSPQGGLVWQTNLIPPGESEGQATGGGLAYADGTLYVSSGFGRLTAIEARTGGIRWRQRLDATGSGKPTVRDGLLYLVAGDEIGWAIETKTGRIAWQTVATPSVGNVLGAPAPALGSELVVFGFGSGDVTANFRRGGVGRWNASVTGRSPGRAAARIGDVTGAPVISGSRVYIGNHSGRTVSFDMETGDRLWTMDEGALGPVWPVGDSVFFVSDRNRLLRVNAASGETIWATELPGFVKDKPRKRSTVFAHYGPILAGGRIVVASSDGRLRFFSAESGALSHQVEIPDGATSGPVVAGGTLYVVSTKGQLHAFR
ncbi:PQQ-binding-like beta-propeller repeat protein [Lutimaribacter marinistellae]|uniref:PQQ-binding-like beta-propeller repeat protein n=1 Tax=Lutimaribacter marinistellae TaxID=1820329 RepID=A0ABV7TNX4_9RHOB